MHLPGGVRVGFLDHTRGKGRVLFSSKVDNLCEVRIISIPVTMQRMLDNIFIIAFLMLALSSSRADDYVLAGILGRDLKGDASLYSFPATLGSFMLRKTCLLSRAILPVCVAFGEGGCIEH